MQRKNKRRPGTFAGVVSVVTSFVILVAVFALVSLAVCTPKLSAAQVLLKFWYVLFCSVCAAVLGIFVNKKWGR